MTAAPLHWIKEIHSALTEAKQIPLYGFFPAFPWEEFSQSIASLFQTSELKIAPRATQFLTDHAITAGLGAGFISIALDMTPLSNQAFWMMGKEDIGKLTDLALMPTNEKGFSSPKFQEGFYYFLATKALQTVNELKIFGDLSAKIGKAAALPPGECLCIDVELQHPKQTFWGRLVCPLSFHQDFKTHFSTQPPPSLLSYALTKQIDVSLALEVGHTALSLPEWKRVSVGDFILLDRCTFDPRTYKGTIVLTLEKTPLLRARIKQNSLKIVDYAFYREEERPMNSKTPEDEEEIHEEISDHEELASLEEESADEDPLLSSSQNVENTTEKMIAASEIPLTITVEIARLRINLDKLLQLSPGNLLELPTRPEQGVDLTIDGKKIAKAELIKLGEMLGVKILQLGE
jgi:flagellar motor switch protein FliN/FliY